MTDEKLKGIIKTLELCTGSETTCKDCPYLAVASPSFSVRCEDTLHEASLEAIEALKVENVALRERLNRAIELPFFQKDGEVIVLIYKNNEGVVLTETYFEDVYYDGKRGNVAAEARLAELKEYVLSDKYEDELGKHEVFELLPDRKEKIVTGWKNSHDGVAFVTNSTGVDSYVDDFYGEDEFIEYYFGFHSTDKERAKMEVCKKISSLIKQIVIMGSKLGGIVDNLKDM